MPYSIKKQKCKDSQGNDGNYVLVKDDNSEVVSCHASRQDAIQARKARYANEAKAFFNEEFPKRIALGEVIFNAPLDKSEVDYKFAEDLNNPHCASCAHFRGLDYGISICHIVKGLVKWDHVCDKHTRSLVNDTDVDEQDKKLQSFLEKQYSDMMDKMSKQDEVDDH